METPFERSLTETARLSGEADDLVSFWNAAAEAIAAAVPYYATPCWYTLDPASLLITSHFNEGLAEFPPEWLVQEYYGGGINAITDVARSAPGISTLHDATGGDPTGTLRWQQNMTMGGDQELILALRSRSGQVWGALGLYREPDRPLFDSREKAFLRTVAPYLAQGARRALLVGEATDPSGPDAPGLVILNDRWQVESCTSGIERWLHELPDGNWDTGRLPSAVLAVAGLALQTAENSTAYHEPSVSRVLSRSGRWLVLHGSCFGSGHARRVAVIVEPAHPAHIYPLLMAAYDLTERECEVTRLVLQGNSTAQIATALVVSPHTVQQHLKHVFEKTGVRSRRELVGTIFFDHYEPRLRDNERRVAQDKPIRGGPLGRLVR